MKILALAGIALVLACGAETGSPEDQIRALLNEAELAAEAKDVAALKELISDGYRDEHANDKAEVARLLAYLFFRHTTVHLLVRSEVPDFPTPGSARVRVFAVMTGTPLASAADLAGLRADLYRFDFEMTREEDEWRVVGADWDRARLGDFTEDP